MWIFFFFSSRRRHTRWNCDWSSDVCSSDLDRGGEDDVLVEGLRRALREDELPQRDRIIEDSLRDDPEDVYRLRESFVELRGGGRLTEDAEHRLLRGVDERRGVVPP